MHGAPSLLIVDRVHHFIVLSLFHDFKNLLEYGLADIRIGGFFDIVKPVVESDPFRTDVSKHGLCKVKLLLIFIAEFINERRKESEGGSVFAVNPVFFIDDISRLYFLFFVTVF